MDGEGKQFTSPGKGVEKCRDTCDQRVGCTGFEYNRSGSENYKCATFTGGDNNLKSNVKVEGWISCVKTD